MLRKVSGESGTIVQDPWNWLAIEPEDADSMTPGGGDGGKAGAFCAREDSDRFVEAAWDLQCTPARGFRAETGFWRQALSVLGYRGLNV